MGGLHVSLSKQQHHRASLIVVNYNGLRFLRECILSLLSSNHSDFEIILVDNGSTDGSIDSLGALTQNPQIQLVRLRENIGYGRACNLGAEKASGETLAFLNNDLLFSPDWLGLLISAFQGDPTVGAVQPKLALRDKPEWLDAAGGFIDIFGCAHERRGLSNAYRQSEEIFYAKGAAILIPSRLFSQLGGFDEDFFLYYEETDLCWRIWLSGHRVLLVPGSTILHVREGITAMPDVVQASGLYRMARLNRFRMIFKNYEKKYLFAFMPIIALNYFKDILLLMALGAHYSAVLATLEIPWRLLKDCRRIVGKRGLVQRLRRVSDGSLIGNLILLARPFFVPHEFSSLQLPRKRAFQPLLTRLSGEKQAL